VVSSTLAAVVVTKRTIRTISSAPCGASITDFTNRKPGGGLAITSAWKVSPRSSW
jgi:hypothetical protein